MKRSVQLLFCIWMTTATFSLVSADAQGLKSDELSGCHHYGAPPPLIAGESDSERWIRFLSIQPFLIGMKFDEVEKWLGSGRSYSSNSELEYQITESKLPSERGNLASINLTLRFDEKGTVRSFEIIGVPWG